MIQRDAANPMAVRDCYIWEDSLNYNGNSNTLYTGLVGTGDKNSFLWFDVSRIPPEAIIKEARLLLESTGTSGVPIEIHEASTPWMETEPTWMKSSTAFLPRLVSTFTPVPGRNFADVTAAVMGWHGGRPNNGLVLLQVTRTASATFNSSEISTVSLRPALEVLYDMPKPLTATAVPALVASCGTDFTYPLRANAPEATQWTAATVPDGFALDAATGAITWTPKNTQRGAYEITVKAATDTDAIDVPVSIEVRCVEPFRVGLGCTGAPGSALVALGLLLARRRR